MKNRTSRIIAAIVLVAGLGLGVGLGAVPKADAQGSNSAICYNGQCQNKWNNGTQIRFYQYSNGGILNNGWGFHLAGQVSNGTGGLIWPFTNGSGLNNRYNTLNVLQIGFQASGGDFANGCMSSQGFDPGTETGQLETQSCVQNSDGHKIPDYQLFVVSNLGFIIPVYASNIDYTFWHNYNRPIFEGATGGGTANGQPVIMTPGAGQLGPWTFPSNVP